MRKLREDRLLQRPRRKLRRRRGVVMCDPWRDSVPMRPQKTQIRQRLGAKIRNKRKLSGMKKQDDLAAKTGLSVSVISLAERGEKVDDQTLRLIELGLDLPTNSTIEFLRTGDDSLLEVEPPQPEPADHYPAELVDPAERRIWDIEELTEEQRWRQIEGLRADRAVARRVLQLREESTRTEQSRSRIDGGDAAHG